MHDSGNLKSFSVVFCALIILQGIIFIKTGAVFLFLIGAVLFLMTIFHMAVVVKGKQMTASGHILNTSFLFYTFILCYKTGGLFSITIFMLFFTPLFIQVLNSKTEQFLYMAAAFAVAGFFYLGQQLNISGFVSGEIINVSIYRGYNLFVLLVCFFTAIYQSGLRTRKLQKDLAASREESHQIKADAVKAMKIKDEFLANMSHEIRNPMNGIIGMMHVLLDSDLNEDQKHYSKIVYNSARALLTIVNDILDLSKIEAGKLELDVREFDLEVAIKDIVSLPELQARQKGIDFSCSIDEKVPYLLKGDIGRIRQVINNLTGNAIKFTDSGEVILSITLESDDNDKALLHFSVEDTGIGIKEEQIESLFQSFTQADLSITKRFGGTGLGLSICKMLVEKMGGKMGAQSIELIGSTFWFTLPLAKQTEKESSIDPFTRNVDESKVLVISDGASLGINFERNLNALGINYEQAYDDTEAVEMIKWACDKNKPFHLIIMETKESDIKAESLAQKIKRNELLKHSKMMLLTSIGKKGDAKHFEKIGFSAYLSKPVEKQLLLDAIKSVLSRPHEEASFNLPIITKYSIIERKKQLRRILLVDDIETNLLTAKALISKQGYKIDEAKNGLEALEKFKENNYDLILMDCQMPELDGYETTRQIREIESKEAKKPVPIIAMTGNAFEKDQERCFDAGMDDFIAKPIEPEILTRTISAYISDGFDLTEEIFAGDVEGIFEAPEETEKVTETEGALVFDREKLFERFGNDEEMVEIIVESFLEEAPELIENMANAIDDNDLEGVQSAAHALKGSAANVNAEVLKEASLAVETNAKNDNPDGFAAQLKLIQDEFNIFSREAIP